MRICRTVVVLLVLAPCPLLAGEKTYRGTFRSTATGDECPLEIVFTGREQERLDGRLTMGLPRAGSGSVMARTDGGNIAMISHVDGFQIILMGTLSQDSITISGDAISVEVSTGMRQEGTFSLNLIPSDITPTRTSAQPPFSAHCATKSAPGTLAGRLATSLDLGAAKSLGAAAPLANDLLLVFDPEANRAYEVTISSGDTKDVGPFNPNMSANRKSWRPRAVGTGSGPVYFLLGTSRDEAIYSYTASRRFQQFASGDGSWLRALTVGDGYVAVAAGKSILIWDDDGKSVGKGTSMPIDGKETMVWSVTNPCSEGVWVAGKQSRSGETVSAYAGFYRFDTHRFDDVVTTTVSYQGAPSIVASGDVMVVAFPSCVEAEGNCLLVVKRGGHPERRLNLGNYTKPQLALAPGGGILAIGELGAANEVDRTRDLGSGQESHRLGVANGRMAFHDLNKLSATDSLSDMANRINDGVLTMTAGKDLSEMTDVSFLRDSSAIVVDGPRRRILRFD